MDRLIRLVFACMALGGASTTYSAQVSDMAPCSPSAAQETSTLESFLIVHVVCSDVLLEIPVSMPGRALVFHPGRTAGSAREKAAFAR